MTELTHHDALAGVGSGATVLIAAGGTGGHVYPALAVAEWLRDHGARVMWLGTPAGIESRVVPNAGFELFELRAKGLRGTGAGRWIVAPFVLAAAVLRAMATIRRERADVVLGMGGYVSGPGGLAGRALGRPLVVHEQNAVPGLTNRVLARLASRVLEAFPASFAPARSAVHVGNPVRESIAALPPPRERMAARGGPLRVLVIGGSQGARALNALLPGALAELAQRCEVEVRHQTGASDHRSTQAAYEGHGLAADATAFIDDMASAYAWADVVVCRSGAMTVTELSAAGLASVLVPFPFAVDDHQTANARTLERVGAAVLMPQSELDAARLVGVLAELASRRPKLIDMAEAARRLAMPDAAAAVGRCCLEFANA